jgi:hypothetical protein
MELHPSARKKKKVREAIHKRAQSIIPLIVLVVGEVANIIELPNKEERRRDDEAHIRHSW